MTREEEAAKDSEVINGIAQGGPITFDGVTTLMHYLHFLPEARIKEMTEGGTRDEALADLRQHMAARPLEERIALLEEIAIYCLFRERSIGRMFGP